MTELRSGTVETTRHRTAYLEAGAAHGPLMILVHGWPGLGLIWRHQVKHFAAAGWRCVAPDMRGYGGSSVPTRVADYAVRETTVWPSCTTRSAGRPPSGSATTGAARRCGRWRRTILNGAEA